MEKIYLLLFFLIISFAVKAQNLKAIADSIRVKNQIPEIAFAVVSADSIYEFR